MKRYVVGVDIGGTKIACGLVSKDGKLFKKKVFPTLADKGFQTSLSQVYRSIEHMISFAPGGISCLEGIGVCAPGPLDPVSGIVHNPPNLKGWKDIPLKKILHDKFGLKVKVENDANAAGIAEMKWGAAKGYKNVIYVTVSTGIGTAILIDGKIYHGKNGMAGEGGHVTINYDDKETACKCGNTGCIEALASGTSTAKRLATALKKGPLSGGRAIIKACGGDLDKLNMRSIEDAAKKGNRLAVKTILEQASLIGIWLGGMISVLDPDIIVIGGGVSLLGKKLFDPIRETVPRHTINIYASNTPVVPAKLRRDVGIFGAASVILYDDSDFMCKR